MFSQSSNNRIKKFMINTKDIMFENKDDFDSYFDECTNLAYDYVIYYDKKRQRKQRQTIIFRILIGLCTTFALIFPLLDSFFSHIYTIASSDFAEVGNKLLIISGILYAIQSYYGATNGHIRYVKTQLKLEEIISIYKTKHNAILSVTGSSLSKDEVDKFSNISKEFIENIFKAINEETTQWAKDLVSEEKSLSSKYLHKNKG